MSSAGSSESILDEITVVARLAIGLERLRLVITSERIVIAHVGKRGGGLALGSMAGIISAGLESILKGGRESVKKRRMGTATPQQILASDKDNFAIRYSDIVSVELAEGELHSSMVILTRDDKLQFTSGTSVDKLHGKFYKVLRNKLSIVKNPSRNV